MRLPALNRSMAMLLVAIAAGVCAAWSARQYLQQKEHLLEARSRAPMVERVVAAYDLPAGTRLGSEHLAIRSFPSTAVASDSIPPERYTELNGNFLAWPLRAGDAILPLHARAPQQNSPFSSQLSSGRRAITIPVDAINSVSGLLHPGDLIDLYVSFEYQRRRITAPLLQGVLVLATGAVTQIDAAVETGRAQGYTTVTLDAAPEDAVKLVAARQSGMITALLRNPQDNAPTQKAVRGDLATLLGVSAIPPAIKRKAPVIYGNQTVRNVPGLNPAPALPRQASGVFDLPYMPELVSAWMRAQTTGATLLPDGFPDSDGVALGETVERTGEPQ